MLLERLEQESPQILHAWKRRALAAGMMPRAGTRAFCALVLPSCQRFHGMFRDRRDVVDWWAERVGILGRRVPAPVPACCLHKRSFRKPLRAGGGLRAETWLVHLAESFSISGQAGRYARFPLFSGAQGSM